MTTCGKNTEMRGFDFLRQYGQVGGLRNFFESRLLLVTRAVMTGLSGLQ
jgi:hypothetical protein